MKTTKTSRLSAIWRVVLGLATLLALQASHAQSLYDETTFRALTSDHKAFRVGDVLTVQVVENAMATANADTGTQRRNNLGVDLSVTYPRVKAAAANAGVSGDFDGGGRTERAGRLVAQLTVSIRDVLANGDLLVAGEQQLTINDERQRITLTGRVRPQDISESNTVLSTRIADADITYVGEGHLADRQKPAWWRQVADWLGF
ncbi:MAG TPA: flagellar basal body L-ring protein FlgH [Ideonella sp.]|uniref:flagellar basal body L-ring protein FlgH n=1 Tax=Ideonella sp. TaxID=1929293 RepID=UPI002E2ED5DC|nr:flagellar basal body L-ring protein FlgH [Ideonella sp.]HEX5682645.1 flagellar basal body L-ring protein FlgH [Ideonella sp.]